MSFREHADKFDTIIADRLLFIARVEIFLAGRGHATVTYTLVRGRFRQFIHSPETRSAIGRGVENSELSGLNRAIRTCL